MLWDLIQHSQLESRRLEAERLTSRADSQETRLDRLTEELATTRAQLRRLTELLEARFGEDLNGDGRVGR